MDSEFDYSRSCWEKVRPYFDKKFGVQPFEISDKVKYAKYLDLNNKSHIVALYIESKISKPEFELDFDKLHTFLNNLNSNRVSRIHIVCVEYIASVGYGSYFLSKIQNRVKYYYLSSSFIDDSPKFEDITDILQIVKKSHLNDDNKKSRKMSEEDLDDPFSEENIMKDLMNGDGEKHGFD
jgi:hypothetical protein